LIVGCFMDKKIIAICYDFDKTLATDDMQAFSFIPNLGLKKEEFWAKCRDFSLKNSADPILSFLRVMIDECEARGIRLTRDYLKSLGRDIQFFDGVATWFDRLNAYALEKGMALEHYVITSGNKEILEGCPIFDKLKNVFGCEFLYNQKGDAYWVKSVVNYTVKTQFLFRICKGAENLTDDETVNQRIEHKRVEFRNMIYIGDGVTDIPCMTLVKEKGGTAIAVYPQNKQEMSLNLLRDERVNYVCESDYREGSEIEKLVKALIDSIALKEKLFDKKFEQAKKFA